MFDIGFGKSFLNHLQVDIPVSDPDYSHHTLVFVNIEDVQPDISGGGTASSAWLRMIQSSNDDEKSVIRKQLLQYYHLDTLAMVWILEKIKGMVAI